MILQGGKARTIDGYRAKCKECINRKRREWYKNNKDLHKKQMEKYKDKIPLWKKKSYLKIPNKKRLLNYARQRSKFKNIDFNLIENDIIIPEFCPILGIPLIERSSKKDGNSASVDRIDNTKGYIKGNIAIISYKANRMKSDFTFEEIEKLYLWLKGIR